MTETIRLSASERLDGRPFTDPAYSESDLNFMRRIIGSLSVILHAPGEDHKPGQPLVIRRQDAEGLGVRVIVGDRERLLAAERVFVVGFFGHRRPDIDPTILNKVDEDLIHEFPVHPGVLGYCSFQTADGNYVNLVLLAGPEAKDDWATSAHHSYAARELAPTFYTSVRLQNALLFGGLVSENLTLVRTKYYDYDGDAPWRGLREIAEA